MSKSDVAADASGDKQEASARKDPVPFSGVTFDVEQVTPANQARRMVSLKKRLCIPKIEATSTSGQVLADGYEHGFLNAAVTAFAHHHPISLSPDHFWLLVLQAVSQHVNENAEALRSQFVNHEGKTSLTVRRDDFVPGSPYNDWAGVVHEFSRQIDASVVPGVADRLRGNFSTTGETETIVAKVTVMEMCKKYFDFHCFTMCGIPQVTLEGSHEDWLLLCRKSQELVRSQCLPKFAGWWLPILTPVLDKIAASAGGDVDVSFWQSFVKRGGKEGSGGYTFISGWINCFFPLLSNGKSNSWCQKYSPGAKWVRYAREAVSPDAARSSQLNGQCSSDVGLNREGPTLIAMRFVAKILDRVICSLSMQDDMVGVWDHTTQSGKRGTCIIVKQDGLFYLHQGCRAGELVPDENGWFVVMLAEGVEVVGTLRLKFVDATSMIRQYKSCSRSEFSPETRATKQYIDGCVVMALDKAIRYLDRTQRDLASCPPLMGPYEENFPKGLAEAPVKWHIGDSETNMRFIAGHVGTSQHPETLALRPELGWVIAYDSAEKEANAFRYCR